jgi:hypothetical protein
VARLRPLAHVLLAGCHPNTTRLAIQPYPEAAATEIRLVPQIILRSNRDDLMRNMDEMEKQRKKRNRPVIGEDEE